MPGHTQTTLIKRLVNAGFAYPTGSRVYARLLRFVKRKEQIQDP